MICANKILTFDFSLDLNILFLEFLYTVYLLDYFWMLIFLRTSWTKFPFSLCFIYYSYSKGEWYFFASVANVIVCILRQDSIFLVWSYCSPLRLKLQLSEKLKWGYLWVWLAPHWLWAVVLIFKELVFLAVFVATLCFSCSINN